MKFDEVFCCLLFGFEIGYIYKVVILVCYIIEGLGFGICMLKYKLKE